MKRLSLPLLDSRIYITLAHVGGWLMFFSLIVGFATTGPSNMPAAELIFSWPFFYFATFFLFIFYLNNYILFPDLYLRKKLAAYILYIAALFILVVYMQPFEKLMNGTRTASTTNRGADVQENRMPGPPGGSGFGGPPPQETGGRPPQGLPTQPASGRPPQGLSTQPASGNPQQSLPAQPASGRPPRTGIWPRFDIVSIVLFIMIWSFSTVLQVVHQWRNTERRAVQAEADKARTELSFLHAQINPHFLFNTLNNIYSLTITRSELAPEAILQLSQIMRYVTDEATRDYVPLEREVECIRNYISLQRLRLNSYTTVVFETDGEPGGYQVPPILFMTFIENIFKYGISSHEKSEIRIMIATGNGQVYFECSNAVFGQTERTERNAVGIRNALNRLEQLYPGRHQIEYGMKDDRFEVKLSFKTSNG